MKWFYALRSLPDDDKYLYISFLESYSALTDKQIEVVKLFLFYDYKQLLSILGVKKIKSFYGRINNIFMSEKHLKTHYDALKYIGNTDLANKVYKLLKIL